MEACSDNKGFTFIELMISIVVLSVGLVAVTRTFSTVLNALSSSNRVIKSVLLMEEKIEEFEELNRTAGVDVAMSGGDFEDKGYKWKSMITREGEDDNFTRLDLSVLWEAGRRKDIMSFSTYLIRIDEDEDDRSSGI